MRDVFKETVVSMFDLTPILTSTNQTATRKNSMCEV